MTKGMQPADLSPEQRLHELAAILAAGVLRMRRPATPGSSEIRPESVETCLELPAPTVLTVSLAVNGPREPEIGCAAWN